jgi:DNA-binding NarL/FixJ family response regulator
MLTSSAVEPGTATRAIRVVIANNHDLARAGLRSVLESDPEIRVTGEAATGREAVDLCCRLTPDLALLDAGLPELDATAATRAIRRVCPDTGIVILTPHRNPGYKFEALRAGASAFLDPSASGSDLLDLVRTAARGAATPDPALLTYVVRRLAIDSQRRPGAPATMLTPREIEVLTHIAQGRTNREIAQRLGITIATVKVHVEKILAKLGASARTDAAVRAIKFGIIPPSRD